MNEKTKRIMAIVALVFMGVFTVSFIAFLITRGNVVAFITLFSGVVGVCLFLVIRMFTQKNGETAEPDGGGNPDDPDGVAEEAGESASDGKTSEEENSESDNNG